jgi:hypothetical protein
MRSTIHSLFVGFLLVAAYSLCGQSALAQDDGANEKVSRPPGVKICAPTFSNKRIAAPASGGSFTARVNLPIGCNSSVTYWTDSFISTPQPQDSRGPVTLSFKVAANDSKRRRTGKIRVTGVAGNRKRTAHLTIVQQGRS